MTEPASTPASPPRRRLLPIVGIVAAALAAWGIWGRLQALDELRARTESSAVPTVATTLPSNGEHSDDLVLPASLQAVAEAPLHARVNGYLKRWLVDIGAEVKAGDLLAEIDAPELDQQLLQATADLATAKANARIAASTAARWQDLLKRNFVSHQATDEKNADAHAKQTVVDAAAANVSRLKELVSFKRIVAPFDGIITSRNTEVGALVQAGSESMTPELFHIADTHELIAYLLVPQAYAADVKSDTEVTLQLPEHPEHVYQARVYRTAQAIDQNTRTLLTEVVTEGDHQGLLTGSYIEAHLKISMHPQSLRLPATALLFRTQGLMVAIVKDGRVRFKPVIAGRDFGTEVEILSGLDGKDEVVLNPPDALADGMEVKQARAVE